MKILILGHGQHGKDTFAEMLSEKYNLRFQSSSLEAFEAIKPALKAVFKNAGSDDTLYKLRRHHRELYKALISLYNTPDKSALSKKIISHNDIYVGMRSSDEFIASKNLFSLIFWVDAMKRVNYVDPSMSIRFTDDMIKIDNNGSIDELKKQVDKLGDYFDSIQHN